MYKKLFEINYNNKRFIIFIDNHKRKTFLEINNNGKYIYPSYEDFKALHNIYNNHNPFLCYDIKKYIYKEKVRLASGLLSVVVTLNSLPNAYASSNITIENEQVSISENISKPLTYIDSLDELDSILGFKTISKEEVSKAIDNNNDLDSYIKKALHDILDLMIKLDNNADLRIFYHNIKTLKSRIVTQEEFKNIYHNYAAGVYDTVNNTITICYGMPDSVLYHELWHSATVFYYENNEKVITNKTNNTFLSESLTNEFIKNLRSTEYSYKYEGLILNYLLSTIDYNFSDYNHKGESYLRKLLKLKFPNIDIDYIINTLNTYNISKIYIENASITNLEELNDELFKICLEEIDTNDIYKSFNNFARTLIFYNDISIVLNYLEKYNAYLKNLGITNIEEVNTYLTKIEPYLNITGLSYEKDSVSPIIKEIINGEEKEFILNSKGEKEELTNKSYIYNDNIKQYIAVASLNEQDLNSPEFWKKLAIDFNILTPKDFQIMNITNEKRLITNDYITNLNVTITKSIDNKIGFRLYKDSNIIYSTNENVNIESNPITLTYYLNLYESYNNSLDLTDIFNNFYLTNLLTYDPNIFNNIHLDNNNIIIEPNYYIEYFSNNMMESISLHEFYYDYLKKTIMPINIPINLNINNNIKLYDILKYYNILNPNTIKYSFNEEDIKGLFNNYIIDTTKSISNSMII